MSLLLTRLAASAASADASIRTAAGSPVVCAQLGEQARTRTVATRVIARSAKSLREEDFVSSNGRLVRWVVVPSYKTRLFLGGALDHLLINARELANWPDPIHEDSGTIQMIIE